MLCLWLTGPDRPLFLKTRNPKTKQQTAISLCIGLIHAVCPEAKTELLGLSLTHGTFFFFFKSGCLF